MTPGNIYKTGMVHLQINPLRNAIKCDGFVSVGLTVLGNYKVG